MPLCSQQAEAGLVPTTTPRPLTAQRRDIRHNEPLRSSRATQCSRTAGRTGAPADSQISADASPLPLTLLPALSCLHPDKLRHLSQLKSNLPDTSSVFYCRWTTSRTLCRTTDACREKQKRGCWDFDGGSRRPEVNQRQPTEEIKGGQAVHPVNIDAHHPLARHSGKCPRSLLSSVSLRCSKT
ncbi:hypothetical protein WMY93_018982 [Mugilogobius chulae]|uniref:Uncharacterized protein n=1 Tax=Mugilogobius chulae TaxID=88201 RepID=A0AAW0NN85_9GOBI